MWTVSANDGRQSYAESYDDAVQQMDRMIQVGKPGWMKETLVVSIFFVGILFITRTTDNVRTARPV